MVTKPDLNGFRVPAEWESQAAVWISWPVSDRIWPRKRKEIWETFARLTALMSRYQSVCINAVHRAHTNIRLALNEAKADLSAVTLYPHQTDDVWCRDHGPIWLKNDNTGEVRISNWGFNAWGGKFSPYDNDNRVPARMAESLGIALDSFDTLLEGGALEFNGANCLITTESVLLNANRGSISRTDWQVFFRERLGIQKIVWLKEGLLNDDTDGHVDNIARFVDIDSVLIVSPGGEKKLEINLERAREQFKSVQLLPRLHFTIGPVLVPASYANYVLLNGIVLVPAFGQNTDEEARGIIADCFPGHRVTGFDCRLLLEEGGGLHCLTNNQPA